MKLNLKIPIFAMGSLLAVELAQSPCAQAGLVINGGFETGNLDPWWGETYGKGTVGVGGFAHSGSYGSAFLAAGSGGMSGGFALDQAVSVTPGQSYLFSAWVYTGGATGGYAYLDEDNAVMAAKGFAAMGLDQWQYVSTKFTAAASTLWLRLVLDDGDSWWNQGQTPRAVTPGETVHFDDVALTPIAYDPTLPGSASMFGGYPGAPYTSGDTPYPPPPPETAVPEPATSIASALLLLPFATGVLRGVRVSFTRAASKPPARQKSKFYQFGGRPEQLRLRGVSPPAA